MARLTINLAMTVDGAYEAPSARPDGWLVMAPDSLQESLAMWEAAAAMVLGRRTYEGLAAVWPQMSELPGVEAYAARMNGMPKYVASRTRTGPLDWNASLLEGDPADALVALKQQHEGDLVVCGGGELAHHLLGRGVVDELWLTIHPHLLATGPRAFADLPDAMALELTDSTTYPSGVVRLVYRTS